MVASVSRKNRFKKTFVGGQFPRSKGRHAKWNRFHRFPRIVYEEEEEEESVSFPRFAGLARDAVDGIEKKVRRSLSRVRPNDYGRGSNFASCRLHHPVLAMLAISRIPATYSTHSTRICIPAGIPNLLEERRDRLEKSSMRYATGESRENANGIHLLKRDEMAFQVSRAIRIPKASHPRDNHSRQIKKCS